MHSEKNVQVKLDAKFKNKMRNSERHLLSISNTLLRRQPIKEKNKRRPRDATQSRVPLRQNSMDNRAQGVFSDPEVCNVKANSHK